METIGKVTFHDQRLRRPALGQMAFGYEHHNGSSCLATFRVDIDDLVGMEWPDTERYVGILAHMQVA